MAIHLKNVRSQGAALGNLGVSNMNLQRFVEAEQYLTAAYQFGQKHKDEFTVRMALERLISFYNFMSNFEKADECQKEIDELDKQNQNTQQQNK